MKEKLMIFIIGVLVGAVLATGAFFIYTKVNTSSTTATLEGQMPGGNPPEMEGVEPKEMPNGQRPEMDGAEPPAKPGEENNPDKSTSDTTKNN